MSLLQRREACFSSSSVPERWQCRRSALAVRTVPAAGNLRVLSSRILGKNRNVAKLQLSDSTGCVVEAVYFGEADEFVDRIKKCGSIAVTYYPEINRYQGRETLQIVIRNYITE